MIILDFYPIHHSISEILVTYSRESKYLKNYYLYEDEIKYLNKYIKSLTMKHKIPSNKTKNQLFKNVYPV